MKQTKMLFLLFFEIEFEVFIILKFKSLLLYSNQLYRHKSQRFEQIGKWREFSGKWLVFDKNWENKKNLPDTF